MADRMINDLVASLGFKVDHAPLDATIEKVAILVGMIPQIERLKALGVHIDIRVTDEIGTIGPHIHAPEQVFGRDHLPS